MDITERNSVFATPWFQVIAKHAIANPDDPYYSLELPDYVSVLALTEAGDVLLVKQYRPAIEAHTLELPSGQLEPGEQPEETAKRELLEETGYQAETIELLGCLAPDTGRLSNCLWGYIAADVTCPDPDRALEPGIELVILSQKELALHIQQQQFDHALHLALILLAVLKGKMVGLLAKD